jgi:regulator of sirC expression with transglutaminase-like and TPR domain
VIKRAWVWISLGLSLANLPAAANSPFLDRWIEFEHPARAVAGETIGADELRREILTATQRLRSRNITDLRGVAGVQAVSDFVYKDLGVEASDDLADPDNLFLGSVLARRRGYCIGIAALYLALAEQLDLPIFAVATPTHVFLRYDDGTTRVNIEPFQQGAALPDAHYVREHRIPERSVAEGVFLRNLTVDEFLARAHNNLGVIHSHRKDFGRAAAEYESAARLDARFPAPLYNLGNDRLLQGDHRRAARLFSKALRLHPTDIWALNNRGLAYVKQGKPEKARRDFEAALRIDPGFEQARRNLEQAPPAE